MRISSAWLSWASPRPFSELASWQGQELVYIPDLYRLHRELGESSLMDHSYDPRECQRWLDTRGFIEEATEEQLRALLTHCVRAERFTMGAFGHFVADGVVLEILERLAAL